MIEESASYFFESLQYPYLQRALISTIIVGVVCGIIGVFIVMKGLSFLGAGIAHSCFAGGALAILIGIDPFFTILAFGEGSALLIGYVNEKESVSNKDTAVGIMFSFTMALAILFIGLMDQYSANVQSLLFGNALTVSEDSMWRLIIVAIVIMVVFFAFKKELLFIIFDEEMAKISGIPVRKLNYLFIILIAGIITVSLKAIGAILVFAMIVTPGAAAYQWSYNTNKMLGIAAFFGGISAFLGIYISFMYDLPTGSSIVLVITAIFILSFLCSPKRRAHKHTNAADQTTHKKECKYCVNKDIELDCPYCINETGSNLKITSSSLSKAGDEKSQHHDHSHE
jgi:ABC-type Mn2+/Zn2+ transport system permease subunit